MPIMKKTFPFTLATKKNKILRSKHNQDVKELYLENYKTLEREIEEDTNK